MQIPDNVSNPVPSGTSDDTSFTHEAYRMLLQTALSAGYNFIGYREAASQRSRIDNNTLICLWRHDCDNDLVASEEISAIEHSAGVIATYFIYLRSTLYNPLSQKNRDIIKTILSRGHQLGLHFDERSCPHSASNEIAAAVDHECRIVAQEFSTSIEVVSFHQPSRVILDNLIKIHQLNTYDRNDMAGIHYISDSNKSWKGQDLLTIFRERRCRRLQVLTHPEWWTLQPMTIEENWRQIFRHQFDTSQSDVVAREDSYRYRQEARYSRADDT